MAGQRTISGRNDDLTGQNNIMLTGNAYSILFKNCKVLNKLLFWGLICYNH